jgi:hypothetical protein
VTGSSSGRRGGTDGHDRPRAGAPRDRHGPRAGRVQRVDGGRPRAALAGPDAHGLRRHPLRRRGRRPARPPLPLRPLAHPADGGDRRRGVHGPAPALDPVDGGGRARTAPAAGRPCIQPEGGGPPAAVHARGGRRARRPRRRGRSLRARGRRVRALSDPDRVRAPGSTEGGLEAVLGVGHRHLPHLQRGRGQRPRAHPGRLRRARGLRAGHGRRAPHRPSCRSPQRPDRRGGGR